MIKKILKLLKRLWNWRKIRSTKAIEKKIIKRAIHHKKERDLLKVKMYNYLIKRYGKNSKYFKTKLKNNKALQLEINKKFKEEMKQCHFNLHKEFGL